MKLILMDAEPIAESMDRTPMQRADSELQLMFLSKLTEIELVSHLKNISIMPILARIMFSLSMKGLSKSRSYQPNFL